MRAVVVSVSGVEMFGREGAWKFRTSFFVRMAPALRSVRRRWPLARSGEREWREGHMCTGLKERVLMKSLIFEVPVGFSFVHDL